MRCQAWERLLPMWLDENRELCVERARKAEKCLAGLKLDTIYRRSVAEIAKRHRLAAACYEPREETKDDPRVP